MLELMEWMALAVAALGASIAVGRSSLDALSRLRGRRVQVDLTCPKRAVPVACTMILDERRDRYVAVESCSAFADGVPRCDGDCAKLLNLGMPLDGRLGNNEQDEPVRRLPVISQD